MPATNARAALRPLPRVRCPGRPSLKARSISEFEQLLPSSDALGGITRAKSASDANMLRRKGRLKEQDQFIDFIIDMHKTHSCTEAWTKMEKWVQEHRRDARRSTLKQLVPVVGHMFTELPLRAAFEEYDRHFDLSRRRFVKPNFAEIRHILNIAQVHASAEDLQLITFDLDGTLYSGEAKPSTCHMEHDGRMVEAMIELMSRKVNVAVCTAQGYPGDASQFEIRVQGLLDAFKSKRLRSSVTDRFFVLGGECNYLLRYDHESEHLVFVPDDEWKTREMQAWKEDAIFELLEHAQRLLLDTSAALKLDVKLLRKERAVGIIPQSSTIYEVLEDIAITVHSGLVDSPVPFCAFNAGTDVFVDVGNKSIGLHALMLYLGCKSAQALHVGDRFTASGNDNATRDCCAILWVAAPEETVFFVSMLLDDIHERREMRYIE